MSRDGAYWLRRRVRVWSGNATGERVVLAEGVVLGYSPAPTILVRDEHGRDNHWQVTLPIDTLETEVSEDELAMLREAGDRRRNDQLALMRIWALVRDWPADQVPQVPIERLAEILEGRA